MADPFFHELPAGVSCRKLAVFKDGRGILAEVYREEWGACVPPKQWNVVRSLAGTLRGVHVHNAHAAARWPPNWSHRLQGGGGA